MSGMPQKKEDAKFTYRDYLTWSNEERWELIDGAAYDMTPAPEREHQDISRELFLQFGNYLMDKACKVYAAPFDVRLALNNESQDDITNVVQPDITVVCDHSRLDKKGCLGPPDMVIEILSPSTASKDLYEKFELYESAGVREYWLVFPERKTVQVYKLNAGSRYGEAENYNASGAIKVGIFEDLTINLKKVFKA